MRKGRYFVYILLCADKTLYVGSTNKLEERVYTHNNLKSGAHYTKIRRPVVLKYFEACKNYSVARKREGEIKRLTRDKKKLLIKGFSDRIPSNKSSSPTKLKRVSTRRTVNV